MAPIPSAAEPGRQDATTSPRKFGALCAAILGMVLIYGAGFAQVPELHDAAHDTRHAAGFPCH